MVVRVWIPKAPKSSIQKLARRIKPVVRFRKGKDALIRSKRGKLYYIKPVDLFEVSFLWAPQAERLAEGLVPITDITTYHAFGYYGLFKSSIAEVLSQIPAVLVERVVAFEIISQPETADDMRREKDALAAGYHVATVRLYAQIKTKPAP